ncbi:MAG: hypothetical protein JEZ04_15930 [Spirochaetales bacterium]|nr:hypothetical protein [Spirochaetales bacterium]
MMRKIILKAIIMVLLVSASVTPVFGNELSAVWSRIYNTTEQLGAKLVVMQNIVDLHNRDMEPVITDALKEIIYTRDESLSFSERQEHNDLIRIMVMELGNLKAVDAAPDIYEVVKITEDDFLRSVAIVGLGTAGARDYADEIAEFLRKLNLEIIIIENNEKRESLVNACILALERLKHPDGFEPVFYASVGRYSRDSVAKADRALKNMLEDPTDLLIKIVKDDTPFSIRLAALEVENRSAASAERKTELANTAIEVSLIYNAVTPSEREYQTRTKVRACEMIRDLGVANQAAVQWLDLMLNSSENVNEIVICLQALGTYSSDEAVAVLSKYLDFHNERRALGILYKDERAIRECINALGSSGNQNAKPSLRMVEFSNWSNQTIRMAKNAAKNL